MVSRLSADDMHPARREVSQDSRFMNDIIDCCEPFELKVGQADVVKTELFEKNGYEIANVCSM